MIFGRWGRSMWVKICGVRDAATARALAEVGVDAIGLNFYPRSVRYVDAETAAGITAVLPASTSALGLFVNAPLDEVVGTVRRVGLNHVQLHGDESVEWAAELQRALPGVSLYRAWRCGPDGLESLGRYLDESRERGVTWAGVILDAAVAGIYGGTGERAPWDLIGAAYRHEVWPPLILAGGLTPDNVGDGVRQVRPWGVDTASGVESSPGEKDLTRCLMFLRQARGEGEPRPSAPQ